MKKKSIDIINAKIMSICEKAFTNTLKKHGMFGTHPSDDWIDAIYRKDFRPELVAILSDPNLWNEK